MPSDMSFGELWLCVMSMIVFVLTLIALIAAFVYKAYTVHAIAGPLILLSLFVFSLFLTYLIKTEKI